MAGMPTAYTASAQYPAHLTETAPPSGGAPAPAYGAQPPSAAPVPQYGQQQAVSYPLAHPQAQAPAAPPAGAAPEYQRRPMQQHPQPLLYGDAAPAPAPTHTHPAFAPHAEPSAVPLSAGAAAADYEIAQRRSVPAAYLPHTPAPAPAPTPVYGAPALQGPAAPTANGGGAFNAAPAGAAAAAERELAQQRSVPTPQPFAVTTPYQGMLQQQPQQGYGAFVPPAAPAGHIIPGGYYMREGDRNLERVVEAATKYLSGQYAKLETTLGDATSNMRQRGVVINARLQELAAEETRIHEERRRLTEENAHLQQLIASNEKETEAIRDQVGDIGALLTGLNDTLLPQEGNLRPPRESSAVSHPPQQQLRDDRPLSGERPSPNPHTNGRSPYNRDDRDDRDREPLLPRRSPRGHSHEDEPVSSRGRSPVEPNVKRSKYDDDRDRERERTSDRRWSERGDDHDHDYDYGRRSGKYADDDSSDDYQDAPPKKSHRAGSDSNRTRSKWVGEWDSGSRGGGGGGGGGNYGRDDRGDRNSSHRK